jgi:single-strand DNA-binding protein
MSLSFNRVILAGNLTRDPVLRTAGERPVVDFSLAINRRFKGKDGEQKESTTFIDADAWGSTANLVANYLKKGSPCLIEGELKQDTWTDKDGQKRSKLKVVVSSVQFLPKAHEAEGAADLPAYADRLPPVAAPAPAAAPTKPDYPPIAAPTETDYPSIF